MTSADTYMEHLKPASGKEWQDDALNEACGRANEEMGRLYEKIREAEPQLCKERDAIGAKIIAMGDRGASGRNMPKLA
jgi:hypothetical protein